MINRTNKKVASQLGKTRVWSGIQSTQILTIGYSLSLAVPHEMDSPL